jgi:hypothetical protein
MGGLVALLRRGGVAGSTGPGRVPVDTSMRAKERLGVGGEPANIDNEATAEPGADTPANGKDRVSRPLLMVDIDGVISLFGGPPIGSAESDVAGGSFHSIDGIPHFLSATAAAHLLELSIIFDLVWASGWEEKADEHLPRLLGLPAGLPHLSFERSVGRANAHWKLDAIDRHAAGRPLAWLDDALNEACHAWARRRSAPTLLVQTEPTVGLTEHETALLTSWAGSLKAA